MGRARELLGFLSRERPSRRVAPESQIRLVVPEYIAPIWMAHRAIHEGYATWTELNESMTLDDLDLLTISADLLDEARNAKK